MIVSGIPDCYQQILSLGLPFLFCYLVPATIGKLKLASAEIVWAIWATYISGLFAILIEKDTENLTFSISSKMAILIIFSISLFIKFTYSLPWIDLFINPKTL